MVVADGMGRHHGGEVASGIAVSTCVRQTWSTGERRIPSDLLVAAIPTPRTRFCDCAASIPSWPAWAPPAPPRPSLGDCAFTTATWAIAACTDPQRRTLPLTRDSPGSAAWWMAEPSPRGTGVPSRTAMCSSPRWACQCAARRTCSEDRRPRSRPVTRSPPCATMASAPAWSAAVRCSYWSTTMSDRAIARQARLDLVRMAKQRGARIILPYRL